MATETDNRSESQARAQYESIVEMVQRMQHAQDHDGDDEDCGLSSDEIFAGLGYGKGATEADENDRETYHDEDAARKAIQEDALSVQVRSDWHNPAEDAEAAEFELLLCTGGPAVRIIGTLDQWQQPDDARIEHQDWGTPWTEMVGSHPSLLPFCREFWFSV
jgi:hypothetical protein